MMPYSDTLIKGLDSFLKLDLLRYLVFARGKPVAPSQVADDLGYNVADVMKGLREFVALGFAAQCGQDGSALFALTASPDARRAIESLLSAWAGLQRATSDPVDYPLEKEAA